MWWSLLLELRIGFRFCFFFQAEDGIRDADVTGVQTCALPILPPARAREAAMDANPWTYPVMAKEMVREGKVEAVPSPATPEMSDQRDYLFAEVKKATGYPQAPAAGTWVGTALQVKLAGDPTWYTSNHDTPDWPIQRDD